MMIMTMTYLLLSLLLYDGKQCCISVSLTFTIGINVSLNITWQFV